MSSAYRLALSFKKNCINVEVFKTARHSVEQYTITVNVTKCERIAEAVSDYNVYGLLKSSDVGDVTV